MRQLAFLLALAAPACASAQGWFPLGASWTYFYADQIYTGYVSHVVTGDTVVDGQACRVIHRTRTYADNGNVYSMTLSPYCAYDTAGLVWIHLPSGGFDTLYHMDAVPGDRWMLSPLPEPCDSTSYLEVADTGHVVMDGVPLRWLAVQLHFPEMFGNTVFQDTIIERLGTLYSFLPPQNICLGGVDGSEGEALRCYQDSEIAYMATGIDVCEPTLGIAPSGTDALHALFPNPGTEQVTLCWPVAFQRFTAVFTDGSGRAVLRVPSVTGRIEVDTGHLAPGLYLVELRSVAGERLSTRWIKR